MALGDERHETDTDGQWDPLAPVAYRDEAPAQVIDEVAPAPTDSPEVEEEPLGEDAGDGGHSDPLGVARIWSATAPSPEPDPKDDVVDSRVTAWRPRLAALIGAAGLLLTACGGGETPSVTPSPTPSTTASVEPTPSESTPSEEPSESPEPTPSEPEPTQTAATEPPPFPDVVGGYELQGQSGSVGDYINVELEDDFFIIVTFSEVRDYDSGAGNNANERLDEQWFCHDTDSSPVMRWCATPLDGGGHVAFQGDTEAGVMVFAEEFLTLWQW